MNNELNILFITWDGPQTNYVEGLFMPIFHEIQKINNKYKFYYLQFTWGENFKAQQEASKRYNIPYATALIKKKPIASVASMYTLLNGHKEILKYINKWNINVLMPRSTFPVFMTQRLNLNIPIIFDADGLPIEERIDFGRLKRNSFAHKFYEWIEKKGIKNSEIIITRSKKSIVYHLEKYNPQNKKKFFVVSNGRNTKYFEINKKSRLELRNNLGISSECTVFIYAGSFGPQYGWEEMIRIFKAHHKLNKDSIFIFLTGSTSKVRPLIPEELLSKVIIKRVPFQKIPMYLNAADLAFAIREPKLSMMGVSPIKLGEYLLVGLPTIASKGIGDTEEILKQIPGTLLYNHNKPPSGSELLNFISESKIMDRNKIRSNAISVFSLEAAAKSYICALKNLE